MIAIVIAYVETTRVPESDDWSGRDLGRVPTFVETKIARAAMWLNEGTPVDTKKARAAYAHLTNYRVFTYPTTEKEPLERAKSDILKTG